MMGQIPERNNVKKKFVWQAVSSGFISLAALFWGLWLVRSLWSRGYSGAQFSPPENKKQKALWKGPDIQSISLEAGSNRTLVFFTVQ